MLLYYVADGDTGAIRIADKICRLQNQIMCTIFDEKKRIIEPRLFPLFVCSPLSQPRRPIPLRMQPPVDDKTIEVRICESAKRQNCDDIEALRSIAFRLQKENKQLKESYLLLSSRWGLWDR